MNIKEFFCNKVKTYKARVSELQESHDRSFGRLFAAVFLLFALWIGWKNGLTPTVQALAITGLIFAGTGHFYSKILRPLNKIWLGFGLILESFMNPLIMFLIFLVAFIPFSLVAKLTGRDILKLKKDTTSDSYWCKRDFKPDAESFKRQF